MKGIEIRCALVLRGISITELSNRCGVSMTTVSLTIYQNSNYMNSKVVKEIAKILEKPILEIFPNYKEMKRKNNKRITKTGKMRFPFCEAVKEN